MSPGKPPMLPIVIPLCLSMVLLMQIWASAQEDEEGLKSSSFVTGDVLALWRSAAGTTLTYRGIPLLLANPSEFVVHQKWQKVLYRTSESAPRARLTREDGATVLTIRDETDQFTFTKRVIVRPDSTVRLEYEYGVPGPEAAEVQLLFGVGGQWLDASQYQIVAEDKERKGELKLPATGRIDPWSGATQQVFTTAFGTLSMQAQRGLNLYCDPSAGHVWIAHELEPGKTYTQAVDVAVEPGERANTGITLSGLDWPRRVQDGRATFSLDLARTADGPEQVSVRIERAGSAGPPMGGPVTARLSDQPTRITCEAQIERKGRFSLAVVVTDVEDGEQLLRLSPLMLESAPFIQAMPRLSLYTDETRAQIVMDLADDLELDDLAIEVAPEGGAPTRMEATAHRVLAPLDMAALPQGETPVQCTLLRGAERLASAVTRVRKLPAKTNEVKIDNASGALVADGLPFIPFGFYTYYPLKEGVMDAEVTRGFSLFSPYHGGPHDTEALKPIRAYMDRCAALGMRVNYHLMWSNRTEMTDEQWQLLRGEIEAFRDHPAILSWYIADEPTAQRVPHLEKVRSLVRELDPYHPVTVVFYRGADHARQFEDTMDIVMGDPYPIPNNAVTYVSDMASSLHAAFAGHKPLWIVPQAFGGNEWWRREPTAAEQRVMTYLALIHNARGIQYFIRSPQVSFPKSPIMWAECGRLALQTAELTPFLASAEPRPAVQSSLETVHACAFQDRGTIVLLAANTENKPQALRLQLEGIEFSGEAKVVFEDRSVPVTEGAIEEPIDAYGTRAYAIAVGPLPQDDLDIAEGNLTYNPSYEYTPSEGTPAGCYAGIGGAATCFVDSRTARHGRHSLRMTAPTADETPGITPFPLQLQGEQEYRVSIWAKSNKPGVPLKLSLGGLHSEQFELTTNWQEYAFKVKPEKGVRLSAGIGLAGPGVAWLDLFQVAPVGEGE